MKDNTVNVTLSQNKNGACETLVKRLADFTTGRVYSNEQVVS